jgi:hypothetical protein
VISFHSRNSLQSLLLATALPLGLLPADAMSAYAGTVTVTGANGATGAPGKPGSAGGAATATATSSDPSNSATATGGNGGVGGPGGDYYPAGAGGHGGAASSTALRARMVQPPRRRPPLGETAGVGDYQTPVGIAVPQARAVAVARRAQ